MVRKAPRDASTCLGATQVSVRFVPAQVQNYYYFGSLTNINRSMGVASQVPRFRERYQLYQCRCLSLLQAMSSRVYPFPSRYDKPPPTLRDRLNPHLCLLRRGFLVFPAMPSTRTWLCVHQSIHSFSIPPCPLRTAQKSLLTHRISRGHDGAKASGGLVSCAVP